MNRRFFNRFGLTALAAGMMGTPLRAMRGQMEYDITTARRIPKTDTHMHLFGLEQLAYPWLRNAPEINKTFLPEDFIQASRNSNIGKIIFMESGAAEGSSLREIDWVLSLRERDPRIQGIVARASIRPGGRLDPSPEQLLASGWVKGIRVHTDANLLTSADFTLAMQLAAQNGLSVDLLLQPDLLFQAAEAVGKVPNATFILDHLGNPDIKGGVLAYWKKGLSELARRPNVNCKISGLITRAGTGWTTEMLRPYIHYAIEQFGFDRIVYGGDWPVVLRAGSYRDWARAFEKLTRTFSKDEQHRLYHLNADRIYQL